MSEQTVVPGTALELAYEFGYTAQLNPPLPIGPGPLGNRVVFEVTGGTVTGERLNGTFATGGADWIIVAPDGYGQVDVRGQIITDDGAAIYIQYHGKLEMNDKVQAFIADGTPTEYSDHYFVTTPRLECGDDRYAWVNQSVFVAHGHLVEGGVEYEVFRVL